MNDNDIKLLQLIQEVKKGNKDVYDEISNLIIDEVYNLVSFVYKKEETRKKLARHVIVKIIRSINGFDSEAMDIHMWIARFTTIEIYNIYSKQNGNIFSKTNHNLSYEYNSIEEDALFESCAAEYNRAFIDIAELNKINGKLSTLTKAQKIIYEMFCYECFSIDEIEDVLEVDSTYIIDAIAGMREQLCTYLPQESLDSEDSINSTDNDITISEEEAYELNNIYSNHSTSNHSKYYTLFSKKISKKSLVSAVSCAAVILLAVIVVVVVSIRDKNSASNVANYGKISTKSTTSKTQNTTTAVPVSTKKDGESTTQTQTETEKETEVPSTKSNSGNNTYVKPSSNVPNNPTQAPTNKPTDDEPDDTTKPSDEPDDTTKPSDEPDDTTKPSDEPDDTTKPSDEPDDTTKPSDEPDDTTKPSDEPDDTTKPDDNPDDTQKPDDTPDKTSNEDDSTQNEH